MGVNGQVEDRVCCTWMPARVGSGRGVSASGLQRCVHQAVME